MRFHWSFPPAQPEFAGELARKIKVSPLLAQCLLNRGLGEQAAARSFLQPRLKELADPFALPDMAVAVNRLFQGRERREPLVIFGDYDVDGVTSTALLIEVLRPLGWNVNAYLPRRLDEGYGLSREGLENCLRRFPASLLLALDCGSTAVEPIAWLAQRGVDVIVIDHHQATSPAPAAVALVNPRRRSPAPPLRRADAPPPFPPEARSDFTELCSVGLAFKLAHALVKRGRESGLPGAADFDLRPLLDLVALGTIADIVPLAGENRILVSAGLDRLNATRRPGLVALKQVAQTPAPLGAYEVGFQLAPRLNAAGRLETAEQALRLLLARDLTEALPLARDLDACNAERQRIEHRVSEEALAAIGARFNADADFVIVEGRSGWHIGVVGIVASRVLQQFHRPAIIVGGDGAEWRGSGRSIPGFDMAGALRDCAGLLARHGGHASAAGLSLRPENLDKLRVRLNELARQTLKPEDLKPALRLDAQVGLDQITPDSLAEFALLKPNGHGNPPVQFSAHNLTLKCAPQRMGAEKQHLKLWVTDGMTTHEAVWWGAGDEALPDPHFDLAFSPQINQYKGRRQLQLKVLDWRPANQVL
ncbi:MAG: single-stranded-DNA-specific exonuclease RecJ [Limisphaerales bacterium]